MLIRAALAAFIPDPEGKAVGEDSTRVVGVLMAELLFDGSTASLSTPSSFMDIGALLMRVFVVEDGLGVTLKVLAELFCLRDCCI